MQFLMAVKQRSNTWTYFLSTVTNMSIVVQITNKNKVSSVFKNELFLLNNSYNK